MSQVSVRLDDLSARICRGEKGAIEQMRGELLRSLSHLVRQTLNSGDRRTPLARRIHEELLRLCTSETALPWPGRDEIVSCVAGNLCESVISGLQYGARPRNLFDTLCTSGEDSLAAMSACQFALFR
jgi:hypothetical protein